MFPDAFGNYVELCFKTVGPYLVAFLEVPKNDPKSIGICPESLISHFRVIKTAPVASNGGTWETINVFLLFLRYFYGKYV